MKAHAWSFLAVCVWLSAGVDAGAQTPVGALAIDERQGDQYGWAVDYDTAAAARSRALSECGAGCSVMLTFERCAAHAADQDANSTAVGWAESYGSGAEARQAALRECSARGGTGCIVRVWGCNGPVRLDRPARQQIQRGLWGRAAAGSGAGCGDRLFAFALGSGEGTCPVGSYGANGAGLSDTVGNVSEWTSSCWEGDCGRRVVRGGSWLTFAEFLRPDWRNRNSAGNRYYGQGFRVSRTLD